MTISPRTFKVIQQNRTKSLQDTALIQKKYPELEEDLDNGQFADADTNRIIRHNTHSLSVRIRLDHT